MRLRQCLPCVKSPVAVNKNAFSVSRLILQDPPVPRSTMFIPSTTSTRVSFKDSPIGQAASQDGKPPTKFTIDNVEEFERGSLPRTGPTTGRTVLCKPGQFHLAHAKLNLILKEHGLTSSLSPTRQKRLKPSDARRVLRSKRHRTRFNQGIARLVGIVLRMRKKSY